MPIHIAFCRISVMDEAQKRVNCSDCDKSYASRWSLKGHLVGAHNMRFLKGTDMIRVMTGVELEEAKALLLRQQRNGRMLRLERGRPSVTRRGRALRRFTAG